MKKSQQPDMRWTIERDLLDWFVGFTDSLQLSVAVVVRSFLLQLREGDPNARHLLPQFVEFGLREALLDPKVARVQVDPQISAWLDELVANYRHHDYPKKPVKRRHVLNGYIRYLREHQGRCVQYGMIRLPSPTSPQRVGVGR